MDWIPQKAHDAYIKAKQMAKASQSDIFVVKIRRGWNLKPDYSFGFPEYVSVMGQHKVYLIRPDGSSEKL